MKKEDYINKLIEVCFDIDEKYNKRLDRADKFTRMASLARKGLKDSKEFIELERELKAPNVTDFGDELSKLNKIVKQLKKYKNNKNV